MQNWIERLHRVEDALLVVLLSVMLVLASLQIFLRNFFDAGLLWADPVLRVLVLWLGLIGATVATRNNKHIRIDLLSRLFARNTHRLIQGFVGQVSAWTCLVIAWHGMTWVRMDYVDGFEGVAGIPAWMLEIIVPLSFGLIGLRYAWMSFGWFRLYLRHRGVEKRKRS